MYITLVTVNNLFYYLINIIMCFNYLCDIISWLFCKKTQKKNIEILLSDSSDDDLYDLSD